MRRSAATASTTRRRRRAGGSSRRGSGWQRPCYLVQEAYAATFQELIETTKWKHYGRKSGNDKCRDCMVHCGYEPTAVNHTFSSWRGFRDTVAATLTGRF